MPRSWVRLDRRSPRAVRHTEWDQGEPCGVARQRVKRLLARFPFYEVRIEPNPQRPKLCRVYYRKKR